MSLRPRSARGRSKSFSVPCGTALAWRRRRRRFTKRPCRDTGSEATAERRRGFRVVVTRGSSRALSRSGAPGPEIRRRLEGLGRAQHCRVLEGAADDLDADRHAGITEPAADDHRRLAGEIEGDREVRSLEARPFRHLVDGSGLDELARREEHVDPAHDLRHPVAVAAPPALGLDVVCRRDGRGDGEAFAQELAVLAVLRPQRRLVDGIGFRH